MRLDYFLFMAEAEGCDDLVTTKEAKMNAVIKEFKRLPSYYKTTAALFELAEKHNLQLDNEDLRYLERVLN